ncbi:hypothetical protein HanPI659440_Chr05g0211921 [Helianthus annuus]|nr:hypothetical protein HanHA300_Chr05g0187771 [Helianthus annuus]KAJ0748126.1 hypothetical protein HanOQP8_Chr05g0197821 [Helianthus annuus]KAJ0790172.1 hypothetical protein HanPI659440_Chr05g0211921 [Helianthus annuus]
MNNHEKQQSVDDRDVDDQYKSTEDSSSVREDVTDVVYGDSSALRNGNGIGLADRLTDLFVGDGDRDDDLLIHGTVMQWLHSFDMQVVGGGLRRWLF